MRCDRARERLGEYIEGAIKGKDLLAFEAHLQNCPDCRRELDGLKELDARLKQEVPNYWESIEPAPEFMARLKRIQPEISASPTVTLAERFSALWGRHRTALAAGLSVCVVIFLALTIPMFMSTGGDDDESLITAENPPQATLNMKAGADMFTPAPAPMPTPPSRGMLEQAPTMPAGAAALTAATGANESVTVSPSSGPLGSALTVTGSGFAALSATTPTPSFSVTVTLDEITAKQEELAKAIALEDARVQAFLNEQQPQSVQVFSAPIIDFACNGPTVVIEREKADSQEAFLYACVDLDKREVIDLKFSPARPFAEPAPSPSETPRP